MLQIISEIGRNKFNQPLVICECDCGCAYIGIRSAVVNTHTKSCGCMKNSGASRLVHGHRSDGQTRAYSAWLNMRARCNNPNYKQWKDWGGRGITYDPRWESFENFYIDMRDPPKGMSLDREDNNGNYSKDNCRWADRPTQRRNTRNLRTIELDGKMVCMRDYCAAKGIPYQNVISRLHRGWSLERALA